LSHWDIKCKVDEIILIRVQHGLTIAGGISFFIKKENRDENRLDDETIRHVTLLAL
jgi:hypothetical protein